MSTTIDYNGERYYKNEKNYYRTAWNKNTKVKLLHKETFAHELGVEIKENEVVHHIDGDPTNNSIYNLMLLSHGNHTKLHNWYKRGGKAKKEKTCSIDDCEKDHLAKGYCRKHYNEQRVSADCSVWYCQRISWAKGLCGTHHADMIRQARGTCSVAGCEGLVRSVKLDLCKPHYDFQRKHKSA